MRNRKREVKARTRNKEIKKERKRTRAKDTKSQFQRNSINGKQGVLAYRQSKDPSKTSIEKT